MNDPFPSKPRGAKNKKMSIIVGKKRHIMLQRKEELSHNIRYISKVPVKLVMDREFLTVHPEDPLTVLIGKFTSEETSAVVVDEDGNPISGANVTLLNFNYRFFVKMVKTDSSGRFYASVNKEGSYLIYVTCDDKRTPGMDYVPERWRVWLSLDSVSSRQFILKKGASIYLEGDIRHVETNRVAEKIHFNPCF